MCIYDQSIKSIKQCYTKDSNGKTSWFHDKFGSFLINTLNIYNKDNNIYLFKDGIYVRDENEIYRAIQTYYKNAKETFRKEVYKYIQIAAPEAKVKDNVDLIGCKNGVFNLRTNQFTTKYSRDMFLQHKINAEYNPDAKCEAVDKLLDKVSCNNKQIRNLIEEMIGYCLFRNCRYQKCFLLSGGGQNGKSTLLEMIINFIGEENISALTLEDLQDKFKKAELQDKLVNINDDQSNERITDTADFKKIVTGGIMTMERKGKDPFKYKNYAKLIMCANERPKSNDKSDGYYRRFIMVPLNARITKDDADFDPNIIDKVETEEACSYILNLAIRGIQNVIKHGYFSETEETDAEKQEYIEDNDPIVKFYNEIGGMQAIVRKTTDQVYKQFNEWFEGEFNKKAQYNKTTLTKTFKNKYGIVTDVKRINGEIKRIYTVTDIKSYLEPVEDDDNLPF